MKKALKAQASAWQFAAQKVQASFSAQVECLQAFPFSSQVAVIALFLMLMMEPLASRQQVSFPWLAGNLQHGFPVVYSLDFQALALAWCLLQDQIARSVGVQVYRSLKVVHFLVLIRPELAVAGVHVGAVAVLPEGPHCSHWPSVAGHPDCIFLVPVVAIACAAEGRFVALVVVRHLQV